MGAAGETCDLLVIGSGAAGLSTAVTAAHLGLDVIVIEKDHQFGGTTAWSGGWMWIPRNPLAVAAGVTEDIGQPRTYLEAELGNSYDDAMISAFLEHGPRMVAFFQKRTHLQFIDGNAIPDFHDRSPGARQGGRSVCAAPYDGRALGARIKDLKPPLDIVSPFGMGVASGADMRHFLFATRARGSFAHVTKRVLRHARDVMRYGRGMYLANGNALIARLLRSADDLGVRLRARTPARELIVEHGRVLGARAGSGGADLRINARRGVVLACGGFPHDLARKANLFPHAPTGHEHHSAAPETNAGDGLRLGERAGGHVRRDLAHAGAWAPVSLVPRRDGTVGRFPHLIERAKPGLIMVRADGRRFTNEADSYHDVMQALFAATPAGQAIEAWLICDTDFRNAYGLGRVRPRPFPVRPWLRNGYVRRGSTIEQLARACGIDARELASTIATHNRDAAAGRDTAFGRGESPYNRIQGEAAANRANPCLAPIVRAPFYAVKIAPGSLGTFAGLKTDAAACVLDRKDARISGLYAVGNDMSSIMGGRYPAGGITLGPAMTFGYIAAHHAAGVSLGEREM
jgi:succinate dehydrogenase/fumarate reductase flavoprotein subunit